MKNISKEQIELMIESLEELNENLSYQSKGTLMSDQHELLDHLKLVRDNFVLDLVSHYYLVEGDTINRGDEFQNIDGDNNWRITGQDNQVFTGKKHYPHRRKL